MTARSRWGIGGSAIALVIVVVAFWEHAEQEFGASPWIPSNNATATVAFASPGRVEELRKLHR